MGGPLIQYDWCPYKGGNLDTQTDMHRGNTMWRDTGMVYVKTRDWSDGSISQERPTLLANHWKQGRSKEGFPYQFQREYGPCDILIWYFQPPEPWANLLSWAPQFVVLCSAALGNQDTWAREAFWAGPRGLLPLGLTPQKISPLRHEAAGKNSRRPTWLPKLEWHFSAMLLGSL